MRLQRFRPHWVMNLAAESHVDRSIDGPAAFIQTNVVGTCVMLQAAWTIGAASTPPPKRAFRFHHISTDEVFGSLGTEGLFREDTPYAPNSPYSASKAGSDHLVRAWHHTYGLPTLLTNCSNNYGPYHFPEKLIPLDDHQRARRPAAAGVRTRARTCAIGCSSRITPRRCWKSSAPGRVGESYNIGGDSERRNLEVVEAICDLVDELAAGQRAGSRRELITYVQDRPGHDLRYAIDASKIEARNRLAAASQLRGRLAQDGASGISTIRVGGGTFARAPIAASGSASRSEARGLRCKSKTPKSPA